LCRGDQPVLQGDAKADTRSDPHYDGGVAAYAGGIFGPGYFEGYSEKFDLEKAKRWARETRCGVLLLRPYWNASLSGQGHVAILLPSGYVLQSFPHMHGPDLNWDYTIEQSNAGGYYYEIGVRGPGGRLECNLLECLDFGAKP